MITEIEIEGFKSLEKVRLKLGKFNLFIGANASGKSNFFDALRVLQGVGYGLTVDEIFNGKPKGSTNEVWTGIRGGSANARFVSLSSVKPASPSVIMRAGLHFQEDSSVARLKYMIEVAPELGVIRAEEVAEEDSSILVRRKGDVEETRGFDSDEFVASQLDKKMREKPLSSFNYSRPAHEVRRLGNMQNLSLSPDVLRGYGQRSAVERLGEAGENFASLVKTILRDKESGEAYLLWLRQLVPIEAGEVRILAGALGEPLFALRRGSQEFPAPILSDGTLRFAALAAAFFQRDMPEIFTLEEIENGIHPSRLRLLVELLKSQSKDKGPQVFATTHSPVILAWLDESDYDTTFFCKRDEETGASIIKPLSEIPRLVELVKNASLGELFTEGWMEGAF